MYEVKLSYDEVERLIGALNLKRHALKQDIAFTENEIENVLKQVPEDEKQEETQQEYLYELNWELKSYQELLDTYLDLQKKMESILYPLL